MLKSVDKVIEEVGGDAAACLLAGVGPSAVSNWRARGKISQDKFILFRDALAALGKEEAAPSVFGFKETAEVRL